MGKHKAKITFDLSKKRKKKGKQQMCKGKVVYKNLSYGDALFIEAHLLAMFAGMGEDAATTNTGL